MSNPNLLILVDGSSYLFRAYHAAPSLNNAQGQATGALFGVLNMLKRLIADHDPAYMAVIFDAKGKNFRHRLYPDYKANRPPMPEELASQIEPLHRAVRALGLALLCVEDVEADDVIGTLAVAASEQQMEVLISTGDKDMAQLVSQRVTLINTMDNSRLDRDGVYAKFAVWPEQMRDWLALVGDSSDNIPGVPQCGPKTAAKWLQRYPTLEQLIANAAQISGKVGDNLRQALPQLALSRELATIRCDLTLPLTPQQLTRTPPDIATLREIYQWMDSPRLLASLPPENPAASPDPAARAGRYTTILNQKDFDQWLTRLEQAELFALDCETTSLDTLEAEIVGLSFAIQAEEAAYLPLAHSYLGAPPQLDRDTTLARLKPLLEDPERKKVGQNLKYDHGVLANHGITLRGIAFDTMLESYLLNATATRHDLDSLAAYYLHYPTTPFKEVAGSGANALRFDQIPLDQAAPYAAEDADIALRLHQTLWPRLQANPAQARLLQETEIPLLEVLSRIERTGVCIDRALLGELSQQLGSEIAHLEQQAEQLAGHRFNLNSPKQIGQIFFTELQLPMKKKTPKGAPSTAESVLEALAADGFELPAVILRHRSLSKLQSTYSDKLPRMIHPRSGRLHTSYHQAVTATGRLSSAEPNLQNIPIRTAEGRRIRRAFLPAEGWVMLAADYSQIELRILAHLSGDPGLCSAFRNGEDIHRATAAELLAIEPAAVTSDQRRHAKAINFGLVYGISAFGLANQLAIPQQQARDYIERYFARYPGVRDFMEQIRSQAHAQGYVETLFGRRLYLPDLKSRNHARRSAAERTAINAPMQGSAADLIKRAMVSIDQWIDEEQPALRMLMQVHDELVFEVAPDTLQQAQQAIRQRMEGAAELAVPLLVECGSGANWEEAH